MAKVIVKREYFDWMYDLVCKGRFADTISYRKLLKYMHAEPFVYIIKGDVDRYYDGITLRRRYALEQRRYGQDYDYIMQCLEDDVCTVFEMILALAIRCEEEIMSNPTVGDRTGQWFWKMIVNLGLGGMTDDRFDEEEVRKILDKFMQRKHAADGRGGLFIVRNCRHDLRSVEIWTQMTWFLDTMI